MVVGGNYYEELKKSGKGGCEEIVENLSEEHCFRLFNLKYEKGLPVSMLNTSTAMKLGGTIGNIQEVGHLNEMIGGDYLQVSHSDKDCDVWLASKGTLRLDKQEYGAWLCVIPHNPGKAVVTKVACMGDRLGHTQSEKKLSMTSCVTHA
ncbi:hypothetical protein CFP56_008355 [Quercus suber]|uniref:Profilin n=1 Tax=Quercus suber TaxID=58331 RepID=A0AAW0L3X6_QUESU